MNTSKLIPHLFRTEFSKISSVLSKYLGSAYIGIAEDIASDTFLQAMETWPYNGIPDNPPAWLYAVARNKAKNYHKRAELFTNKIVPELKLESNLFILPINLTDKNISDSLLQMLFVICHPSIPVDSQIALSLRILCGFGIDEIASAFLVNKETISKRLTRAKEKLRHENVNFEFPPFEMIQSRIDTVLKTLYLLFSEGYFSESNETVLQEEVCQEAMRLTLLLTENEITNTPSVKAFYALMCFHSSRFPARKAPNGKIILYDMQNKDLWDTQMISLGAYYLH